MEEHALLSASSAYRWMTCTPSARFEEAYMDSSGEAAKEGTLAHSLGEITLKYKLGEMSKRRFNVEFKKIEANPLFSKDMPDYVETYVDFCMERLSEAKAETPDTLYKIEKRLDYSEWVQEGFGTGDFVIISDGSVEVIDLKYGKSPNGRVSALENKQMRLYALGIISEFGFLYDITNIKMSIVQPRLDNWSTDELSADDLLTWAEEVLRPLAALAFKGEGDYIAGEHCKYCKGNAVCSARAEANLELMKYEFSDPNELSKNKISDILGKADELIKWAKDVQEYAFAQALLGEEIPGWKLVEGRSNRRWVDENKIGEILIAEGFLESIIWSRKLTGITNMESALGKKEVVRLLGDWIEKPQGKPTLVPEKDKREVFKLSESMLTSIDDDDV